MLERKAPHDNVLELVSNVLEEGGVTPPQLLESLYYAADEHVFSIMRIVAALGPEERVRLLGHAKNLLGRERAGALAFAQPCSPQ